MSRPNFYERTYQPAQTSSFSRAPSNRVRPQMYTLTDQVQLRDQSLHESFLSKDIGKLYALSVSFITKHLHFSKIRSMNRRYFLPHRSM